MKKTTSLLSIILYISIGYSQLQYTFEVNHVVSSADASIEVFVTNGSGSSNYNYTWYDNTFSVLGTNNSLLSGLNEGIYYLKVEDAMDSDVNNYIYTYFWVGKHGATTTLVAQPNGIFGNDATLRRIDKPGYAHVANSNYGDYANMVPFWGTWSGLPDVGKGITKFEYNGLSQSSSLTANLTLYGYYYRFIASTNPSVHNEVLIKRIKDGVDWKEHTVTYNSFYADNPSVNVENTPVAEISSQGTSGSTVTAQYTKIVDITNVIEDQINLTHENNGLFYELKYNGQYRSQFFYGSDYTDALKRPKITITFTIPEILTIYHPLNTELTGGYYNVIDNELHFSYYERYTPSNTNLNYGIIDNTNTLVSASLPALPIVQGENHLSLDFSSIGLSSGYYILRVTNEKDEVKQLRFKL